MIFFSLWLFEVGLWCMPVYVASKFTMPHFVLDAKTALLREIEIGNLPSEK
jgi:hypothetical protein